MYAQLLSRFNARLFTSIGFTILMLTGILIFPHVLVAAPPLIDTPTATAQPLTAPTVIAEQAAEEWDYVVIGASSTLIYPRYYAEMLEEDLGVSIHLNKWSIDYLSSSQMLNLLQTDEELREAIQNAEIITFEIPMDVFKIPISQLFLPGLDCGGDDNQDCIRAAMDIYKADTEAIFAELVALRSPSEALFRATDLWMFNVERIKAVGDYEFRVLNTYWREANAHVIEVATEYEIPVALAFDAFMGEDGTDTPSKDLLSDQVHPTHKGAKLIAELLRDLGYAYAPPVEIDPE